MCPEEAVPPTPPAAPTAQVSCSGGWAFTQQGLWRVHPLWTLTAMDETWPGAREGCVRVGRGILPNQFLPDLHIVVKGLYVKAVGSLPLGRHRRSHGVCAPGLGLCAGSSDWMVGCGHCADSGTEESYVRLSPCHHGFLLVFFVSAHTWQVSRPI